MFAVSESPVTCGMIKVAKYLPRTVAIWCSYGEYHRGRCLSFSSCVNVLRIPAYWFLILLVVLLMLTLKSEQAEDSALSLLSVQPELDYWERLIFSFDMERDEPPKRASSRGRGRPPRQGRQSPHRSRSRSTASAPDFLSPGSSHTDVQDAALLAQFASAAAAASHGPGTPQSQGQAHSYEVLMQALRAAQAHQYPQFLPPPPQQAPPDYIADLLRSNAAQGSSASAHPAFPPNLSWAQFPPNYFGQGPYTSQLGQPQHPSIPPNFYPPFGQMPNLGQQQGLQSQPQRQKDQPVVPSSSSTASTSAPASTPTSPTVPESEGDNMAVTEDKRRRNTAASARFRIKKKQRALNLERSVSDLEGRAEELEKEAADLRRENGWLKEIVMLKGTRYAAMQAQAAGASASNAGSSARGQTQGAAPQVEAESSDESSEDETDAVKSKRKGKGKGKQG